jgi:hypothetical protein
MNRRASLKSASRGGKPSDAILELRRSELETRIEELIALLDTLDGDPDLEDNGDAEPSIGNTPHCSVNGIEHDLELDLSDYEYSLGWANPGGLRVHIPEEAAQMKTFDWDD